MRAPETEQPRSHIAFFLPDLEMGGAERVFLTLSSGWPNAAMWLN